jgi:putative transposase
MKRSRFSEEQIIGVLKEAEAGVPVKDLCRRVGVSEATFYHWKTKYGGMEVNEARRLRQVEEENGRLKRIVAQQALDLDALKVVLAKSGRPAGEAGSGACRAGRIKAERATRLWADRDAPRELAVPAEGTERSGVAGSAAGVGRRASAIRLSAAVHFPAAGEDRGRNASVVGQSQAGLPTLSGGRAGDAA